MATADSILGGSPAASGLEFRHADDSWYSVRAVLDGDTLTVKYCNFSDEHDDRFEARDFKSLEEVKRFRQRFRPGSVQLQDPECSKVVRGMTVCASHSFKEDDLRFHDAIVEEVEFKKHAFTNGEEECLCIFMLLWLHGPKVGTLTTANIENICMIQSSEQIEPMVGSFLNIVKQKIEVTPLKSGSILEGGDVSMSKGGNCHKEMCISNAKDKSSLSQSGLEETRCARQFRIAVQASEERISNCWERIEQDVDMGGEASVMNSITGNHHFILIDNLEKDLSPGTIVEFMHKQTSISTQACIFPSLSSESYTRGIIVLDCEENLDKLYKFLDDPNHIIMSSTGRPWVMTEKLSRVGLFRMLIGTLKQKSQKKLQSTNVGIGPKLQVVNVGTEEYKMAKQLRDLFMEFTDHQQRLHKKLACEERKILQLSHAA